MNLTQITAFRAVMTSASLSDAAKKLGRTQPAISAAIKGLEEQLGLTLFQRQGRKLIPVPEAQYLLAEAGAILDRMTRAEQTMRALVDGQTGNLNVAAMPGTVSVLFPRFIAGKLDVANELKISIFARSSVQIVELARAQSIDFGFGDAPEMAGRQTLFDADRISGASFAVLPRDHPLCAKQRIGARDLDNVPLGTLQPTHPHTTDLQHLFHGEEARMNVRIESQTFLPILQFVLAGKCATIVDPLTVAHIRAVQPELDGLAIRPLDAALRYHYAIVSPRFRPGSVAARTLRRAWRAEVFRLLEAVGAAPGADNDAQTGSDSVSA